MPKLLFICHGNICRSPMAEFVMKELVQAAGCAEDFCIASAATSSEELGNPVYPPVRRLLAAHGIDCSGKTARRLTAADGEAFDLLIGMDSANLHNMRRICPAAAAQGRLYRLLDFSTHPGDVADPWYTRDFAAAWRDVNDGCRGLLQWLQNEG